MPQNIPQNVLMELLRPQDLEARIREFPVVYVPFGKIEWHGRHLPVGTDTMKAHAILAQCADRFGGLVYPGVNFHEKMNREIIEPALSALFFKLKRIGFRVIIGVSGHNMQGQIDMINAGLAPVIATGEVVGEGLWEISLSRGDECNSDHAAKWETSSMMYFYPECVDLAALGDGPLRLDMKAPAGIKGLDPREHASSELGRRNAELCAAAIGQRARELLATLPADKQAFALPGLSPEHWWAI